MRRGLKWLVRGGLLALLAAGGLWLFPPTRPEGDTELSLMSWNLHGLHGEHGGSTMDLILEGIRAADADLLLLQEFPVGSSGGRTRAALRALGYPHEALFAYNHAQTSAHGMGLAIYARHPIRDRVEYPLMPNSEGRLVGTAVVEVAGRALRVGVVHLPNSDIHAYGKRAMAGTELVGENLRTIQCGDLVDRLEPWREEALVVAGDFNTIPLSAAWRIMRRHYLDAFSVLDWWDGTFAIRPGLDLKIDHIFHSRRVRCREARVLGLAGSDHRPVHARLQF